jgi:hypothetical protein
MNINSYVLKLKGNAELPNEIEIGSNYHVSLEGAVTGYKVEDNEDGTYNQIYDFKPIKVDLLTPKGKSLKLKDARKNSQKFRNYCYKVYINEGVTESFDDVYDAVIWEAMGLMPSLIRSAQKRINGEKTNP